MASAHLGIFTADTSLVVTSWDDWLAEATGIARDDAIGKAVTTLLPDLESRGLLKRFDSVLTNGTVEVLAPALHHYLFPCPPRVSSTRFAQMQQRVTIGPLLGEEAITGVLVTVEDVTARLDAERALADDATVRSDLASPDWRARQASVERVAAEADADFVHALVSSLRHGHRDFNLLSSALKLLGSTNVEVTDALVDLLRDPDPDLRIQAALALGSQHDPAAIPPLREALEDPEVNVRFQAIESLGRLRADAALDDLVKVLEGGDFFLAFAALDAIAAIGDSRVLRQLVGLLDSDTLRVPVAEALGALGDEAVVPALLGALNASSRGVGSIALALATIHERLDRQYGDATAIADAVGTHATAAAQEALVLAIPAASRDELRALVRVLGWLDGETVRTALTLLLSDSRVRAEVTEALVRHGDRVVDRLVEQLGTEDREIRHAAVVALGRVGSHRATAPLVAMLDPDSDLLVAIAGALARIGDKAAFEPLLGLLGHADSGVRQSAIGALNSIGHPQLPSRVRELLGDADPLVRESAVRIAGYFGYPETVEELFSRAHDEDESVRRAALEHLPFVDERRALPVLVTALDTDNARARAASARALGRVDDPAAAAALTAALEDGDAWVRYFAVRGLVEGRHSPAAAALMRLAERDPAAHVRIASLEGLGTFGVRDAMPVLTRLAGDEHQEVAAAALGALGALADAQGLETVRRALRSGVAARRQAAVAGLVVNGSREAVSSLEWAAAADSDPAVAGSAIEGLGRVAAGDRTGADAAIDALVALLGDRATRERAQQVIVRLLESRIPALSRGLQHPQPDVRSATVDVLGRFQCEAATSAVSVALDDATPAVRMAAVTTLARLGARGMEGALTRLSMHDPSKLVRRAAAAALTGRPS